MMTLKITLKILTTLKQHYNHAEKMQKKIALTIVFNQTGISLNSVIPECTMKIFTLKPIAFVRTVISCTLIFQCDFQSHILIVTLVNATVSYNKGDAIIL